MIQDFKTRLEEQTPSRLRQHRHKLVVLGLSVVSITLFLQFAAVPNDTTAAVQEPAGAQIALLELPQPADTAPTGLESATAPIDESITPLTEEAITDAGDPETDENASPDHEPNRWVEHRIQSGESLSRIFKDQGLSAQLLYKITHSSDEAAALARILPGQTLRFEFDKDQQLVSLEHVLSPIRKLQILASDDGFTAQEVRKDVEVRTARANGSIHDSLFVDGQAAGLTDSQIMELAGIFGWDIDFALELRQGDRFSLVYEEHYLDGKKFRNGPILAAEFVNRGNSYRAIRFEDADGTASYYDTDGSSKRRAFIRTPVKFARVSSGFSKKRWHPVLKKWRSHKGTDYAAPTGTPIKSTGAGKVIFRGWKGGYGKVIIVQHGGKYTTLYGHMSRFAPKISNGSRVKQGQVIGYVGQTGLASGPHLHYEFRINGVHRNPLTVKLPKSIPLPKAQLAQFRKASQPLLAQLDALSPPTVVAAADTRK